MKLRRVLRWVVPNVCFVACAAFVVSHMLDKLNERYAKRNASEWRRDLGMLRRELDIHALRHANAYPASLAELEAAQPDLRRFGVFDDPWKSAYVYIRPAGGWITPIVFCRGPDGLAGTADDLFLTRDLAYVDD